MILWFLDGFVALELFFGVFRTGLEGLEQIGFDLVELGIFEKFLRGTGIPVVHPEFRMRVLNFPEPEFRLGNRSTGWGIFRNPSFPRFYVFRGIAMLFIDRETFSS